MDPHEADLQRRNREMLDGQHGAAARMAAPMRKLWKIVHNDTPQLKRTPQPPTAELEIVSKSRSSRFAAFVRKHPKAFIAAAITTFSAALGGELYRRHRGRKQ